MANPEIYKHGLGLPGNEEYDASVRAKIKGTCTVKRKVGQQTRRLREKIMEGKSDNGEIESRLLEIVRNPEVSALKIEEVIVDMLENETLTHRTKVELIGKMVQAHTAIHGSKSKNVNINVDMTASTVIERLKELKRKRQIIVEQVGEEQYE